jgi:hypothetical protein
MVTFLSCFPVYSLAIVPVPCGHLAVGVFRSAGDHDYRVTGLAEWIID